MINVNRLQTIHITSWYPNLWNPHETPFVKEIFRACSAESEAQLWHVQVRNEGSYFRFFSGQYSDNEYYMILDTRLESGLMVELLTSFLLIIARLRLGRRRWDLAHVHIAYPLLRFPTFFHWLYGKKVLISEHWSAYRTFFNLPKNSPAVKRIAKGVTCGAPVVSVSKALLSDIESFAGQPIDGHVIPNIVDKNIFYRETAASYRRSNSTLLMVAGWAPIKRPFLVMESFRALLPRYPQAQLRIVGYGSQWSRMNDFVKEHSLEASIVLLGSLEKPDIAREMRQCSAFVHASAYETFSVVCAEALSCGAPVVASNVGGIKEFVTSNNGLLVENTSDDWLKSLDYALSGRLVVNAEEIAEDAHQRFSPATVASQYIHLYRQL